MNVGVIIMNPVTGESKKYKMGEVPTWVDVAYSADLIIEQLNNWGTYKNGFLNSIFGQKGVVNTTEGYNYLAMNDDVYLYTGITSVVASSIGEPYLSSYENFTSITYDFEERSAPAFIVILSS